MRRSFSLAAACAVAILATAPAGAQQARSTEGTDANGPISIFKNYVAETTPVTVRINGAEIDHLTLATYDDITTDVHAGQNTMTVTWDGPVQRLYFKVAFAATRNNFKNVVVVNVDAQHDPALRQAGAKAMTFTIPG